MKQSTQAKSVTITASKTDLKTPTKPSDMDHTHQQNTSLEPVHLTPSLLKKSLAVAVSIVAVLLLRVTVVNTGPFARQEREDSGAHSALLLRRT